MEDKKIMFMWLISLLVISAATLISTGAGLTGIELPLVWVKILGIADLIALPFLGFSTVKRILNRKGKN